MHYSVIKNCDIANGVGVRVSLFVSGCTNHCKECFQPETWDFCYGQPFTSETQSQIIEMLKPAYIKGLTVLGGEPMEPRNQKDLLPFLTTVRNAFPQKTIWCYTGFTYEELLTDGSYPRCEYTDEVLKLLDVLVDGRFEIEKKDPSLWFRGSSNQRLINVPATLSEGHIVELENRDRKCTI